MTIRFKFMSGDVNWQTYGGQVRVQEIVQRP